MIRWLVVGEHLSVYTILKMMLWVVEFIKKVKPFLANVPNELLKAIDQASTV